MNVQEVFTTTVPMRTRKRFKAACQARGTSMSAVLRDAILRFLEAPDAPPALPELPPTKLYPGDKVILVAEVEIKRRRETPQGPRYEIYQDTYEPGDFSTLPLARLRLERAAEQTKGTEQARQGKVVADPSQHQHQEPCLAVGAMSPRHDEGSQT
jgi:hypothetical protein